MRTPKNSFFYPFLIAFSLFLFIKLFLLDIYIVRERSMMPNIKPGTILLVFKAAYGLPNPLGDGYLVRYNSPSRNDVIVFKESNQNKLFIKRVTGLPNDKISRIKGKLYINGKPEATFYGTKGKDNSILKSSWQVPPEHIFVTGDNRTLSRDSREFGPIKQNSLIGKAIIKLLPLSQFGSIK